MRTTSRNCARILFLLFSTLPLHPPLSNFFFLTDPAPPEFYPLPLPAAFPIPVVAACTANSRRNQARDRLGGVFAGFACVDGTGRRGVGAPSEGARGGTIDWGFTITHRP